MAQSSKERGKLEHLAHSFRRVPDCEPVCSDK